MAPKAKFTYEGGREIYFDGQPLVAITREGSTTPVAADELSKLIPELLNRSVKARAILRRWNKWHD